MEVLRKLSQRFRKGSRLSSVWIDGTCSSFVGNPKFKQSVLLKNSRQVMQQFDCSNGRLKFASLVRPTPAPIAKIRGRYRFHVLLQSPSKPLLQAAVRHAESTQKTPDGVQWLADVDPLDML